jgi:hypothetical protein
MAKLKQGETEEITTRRTVVPTEILSEEEKQLREDPFDYMASLKPEDWQPTGGHIAYVYALDRKNTVAPGEPTYLEKYLGSFTIDDLKQQHGGGAYRIWIKKGSERVVDRRCVIDGPPKYPVYNPAAQSQPGDIAGRSLDMIAAQQPAQAAAAASQVLQNAYMQSLEIMKAQIMQPKTIPQLVEEMEALKRLQSGGGGNDNPLMLVLMQALPALITGLISKMMNPENPIEMFGKFLSAAKDAGLVGGASQANDWKVAVVGAVPQVTQHLGSIAHEWRLGMEAQANAMRARGLPPAPPQGVRVPIQVPPPQPRAVAPNPPTPPGTEPPLEWIEQKVAEMIFDEGVDGHDCCLFLDRISPRLVEQLKPYNPDQIIQFFSTRPILAPAMRQPRVRKFLEEFLETANESVHEQPIPRTQQGDILLTPEPPPKDDGPADAAAVKPKPTEGV